MRFVLNLSLTPPELDLVHEVDLNCAKHISVVNDIYSYDKEVRQALSCAEEGSALCSSVPVICHECNVDAAASKRILWSMCREWERVHVRLVEEMKDERREVLIYCKGLEYQMSGNEMWSKGTKRYVGFVEV